MMVERRTILATGALLAIVGCGSTGGDVSNFADACVESTNLERSLCECAAEKAKEDLSADGFAFLVATMRGDDTKTAELRGKLGVSEAMEAGVFLVKAPAECALDLEGN